MIAQNTWGNLAGFAVVVSSLIGTSAWAQTSAATYRFNNSFSAEEVSAPALTPTDPLALSGFGTDTVFGKTTAVYNFNGTRSNTQQAGLTLDTTSLLAPTNYSVEMVFKFTERAGNWRRIIDVENRKSDSGFYVNTSNTLAVFPVSGANDTFLLNTYYHVLLTVDGNSVKAYQNGDLAFSVTTNLMGINNANNPNNLMHFFLDNTSAGGQQEFSSGSVSLIRTYSSTLSAPQVTIKYDEVSGAVVPEASTIGLWGAALLPIAGVMLRRRIRGNA